MRAGLLHMQRLSPAGGHQSHDGDVGEKRRRAGRGHEAIGRRELRVHAGAITVIWVWCAVRGACWAGRPSGYV